MLKKIAILSLISIILGWAPLLQAQQETGISVQNPHQKLGKQLKGQLHAHSNNSDGKKDPADVARIYRDHGYDFLSITDHMIPQRGHKPTQPGDLSVEGITLLPGIELNDPDADIAAARVEAIKDAILTSGGWKKTAGHSHDLLCELEKGRHLIAFQAKGTLPTGEPKEIESWMKELSWESLSYAAHPADKHFWSVDQLVKAPGLWGLSVFNGHAYQMYLEEFGLAALPLTKAGGTQAIRETLKSNLVSYSLWDQALLRGKRLFAVAEDDAHKYGAEDGGDHVNLGWVEVSSPKNSPEEIIKNLKLGNFYACHSAVYDRNKGELVQRNSVSAPPLTIDVSYKTGLPVITAKSLPGVSIRMIRHTPDGLRKVITREEHDGSLKYNVRGNEKYIRFEAYEYAFDIGRNQVIDRRTLSQPLWISTNSKLNMAIDYRKRLMDVQLVDGSGNPVVALEEMKIQVSITGSFQLSHGKRKEKKLLLTLQRGTSEICDIKVIPTHKSRSIKKGMIRAKMNPYRGFKSSFAPVKYSKKTGLTTRPLTARETLSVLWKVYGPSKARAILMISRLQRGIDRDSVLGFFLPWIDNDPRMGSISIPNPAMFTPLGLVLSPQLARLESLLPQIRYGGLALTVKSNRITVTADKIRIAKTLAKGYRKGKKIAKKWNVMYGKYRPRFSNPTPGGKFLKGKNLKITGKGIGNALKKTTKKLKGTGSKVVKGGQALATGAHGAGKKVVESGKAVAKKSADAAKKGVSSVKNKGKKAVKGGKAAAKKGVSSVKKKGKKAKKAIKKLFSW